MKKLFIYMLIIMILLTPISIAGAEAEGDFSNDTSLLYNLGVVSGYEDGSFRTENQISRIEFAVLILRMLGLGDASYDENNGRVFYDIDENHWAFKNSQVISQMKIAEGIGNNTFGANDNVMLQDAVKMLVSALGYDYFAEQKGGYPNGYVYQGVTLGITRNLSTEFREITRGEAFRLIVNSLNVNFFNVDFPEDNKTEVNSNTPLSDCLRYYVYSGNVTSAYDAQINVDFFNDINKIEINNDLFRTKYVYREGLIGGRVRYYINRDGADERLISYIEVLNEADSFEVMADNIENDTVISSLSYKSGDRILKKSISSSAIFIYNGKVLTTGDLVDSVLKPKSGSVIIRELSDNSQYVIITDYTIVVVKALGDDIIYDALNNNLDISDCDNVIIIKDNTKIDYSDIKNNQVLNAAKSKDGTIIRIMVSEKEISGSVSYSSTDQKGMPAYSIVKPDGEEAEFKPANNYYLAMKSNNSLAKEIKPGDVITAWLDINDKIAFALHIEKSNILSYGYLFDAVYKNGIAKFEVLTTNNIFETLETEENASIIFGGKAVSQYTETRIDGEEAVKRLFNSNKIQQQLVAYSLNENGKLTKIYTADNLSNSSYFSNDRAMTYLYYKNQMIEERYFIDADTAVFSIPYNGSYKELMSAGVYNNMLTVGSHRVALYDIESNRVGAVLISDSTLERFTPDKGGYEVIIDKVNSPVLYVEATLTTADEDGTVYTALTGYQNGERVTFKIAAQLSGNSDSLNQLKSGSVIQYELNSIERGRALTSDIPEQIVLFKVIHDFANTDYTQTWNYFTKRTENAGISTIYGEISFIDNSSITIKCGGDRTILLDPNIMVLKYNRGTRKYSPCGINDLNAGQKVFARMRYQNTREIIICE